MSLKREMVSFGKFAVKVFGLKIPSHCPYSWEEVFEAYEKENILKRPGMIYLNYTIAKFFEQDPEELRKETRERDISYPRQVAAYFMTIYGHKRGDIAAFYNKSGGSVSSMVKRVEDILLDKEEFHKRKVIQMLKYELL